MLTIISVLVGGLIMLMIIRSITVPLSKVAAAAKALRPRLRRRSSSTSMARDEIATVADSFREAVAAQKQSLKAWSSFPAATSPSRFEARSEEDVLGHAFLQLQERMRAALGDHAATQELESGMGELLGTLQHLEHGLTSMNDGDLTVAVNAQLEPIAPAVEGQSVGFVADSYNSMIDSAQGVA